MAWTSSAWRQHSGGEGALHACALVGVFVRRLDHPHGLARGCHDTEMTGGRIFPVSLGAHTHLQAPHLQALHLGKNQIALGMISSPHVSRRSALSPASKRQNPESLELR